VLRSFRLAFYPPFYLCFGQNSAQATARVSVRFAACLALVHSSGERVGVEQRESCDQSTPSAGWTRESWEAWAF
jgi:hypothetical protein